MCEVMRGADLLPFSEAELEEIPLERTPLERVYAQVRFPLLARVAKMDAVADFQSALDGTFPHLEAEREVGIALTAEGAKPLAQENLVWRLLDTDRRWRLSLAPTFLALDTGDYVSRTEFIDLIGRVLGALGSSLEPSGRGRVGVRYVNRLAMPGLHEQIHGLVRREVLGIASAEQVRESGTLKLGLNETLFQLGENQLRVRAAALPERTGVSALQLDPIDEMSWVLDLDMFRDDEDEFDPDGIREICLGFSKQIYRFFRWSVTNDFLQLCGGRL